MRLETRCTAAVVACCLFAVVAVPAWADAELESVETIWGAEQSGQPHNAFTDLRRFKGDWYVGFREALKHHGGLEGKGRLRVLRSEDGETWESAGLFVIDEGDLRDAKLSVTPDDELMVNSAIQVYHPDPIKHKNFVWFSKDGKEWSDPVQIGEPDIWIWSVTWHDGVAYGVGYPTTRSGPTRLYHSEDGREWKTLVKEFHAGNESSLVFAPDGTAFCLLRGGFIGQAQSPYTDWSWQKTANLGGPDMLRLDSGRLIAGGRGAWGSMNLYEINPETGESEQLLALPSQGDSSYPGLVFHDGRLWVSYYTSSDENGAGQYAVPCEIRMAKVTLSSEP